MGDTDQPVGRKVRKKRSDANRSRKPAPSERENWLGYFRRLTVSDQRFEIGYLSAIADGAHASPAPTTPPEKSGLDLTSPPVSGSQVPA